MKVTAFNGSARPEGNTAHLLRMVLAELEAAGVETELVSLAGQPFRGCTACFRCFGHARRRAEGTDPTAPHCAVEGDFVNDCIAKMLASDGILLGSPTYFADVSAELKALIDRAGMVSRAHGDLLRRKVGAGVVAVRRAGAIHAFDSINHFFLIGQMIVVGSSYWNVGVGRTPGEVEGDGEGLETMRTLGRNMSWLLEKLRS
jgi:multimeric flavodoxin WrbA